MSLAERKEGGDSARIKPAARTGFQSVKGFIFFFWIQEYLSTGYIFQFNSSFCLLLGLLTHLYYLLALKTFEFSRHGLKRELGECWTISLHIAYLNGDRWVCKGDVANSCSSRGKQANLSQKHTANGKTYKITLQKWYL